MTGLDLDAAMAEQARANAARAATTDGRQPTFVTGDVAALPFDDASFDLVVSTFSVHRRSDPGAGIGEITRVLHPGGRAPLWDLGPESRLTHADPPTPLRRGELVGPTPHPSPARGPERLHRNWLDRGRSP